MSKAPPRVYVPRPREVRPPGEGGAPLNPEQRAAAEHGEGPLLIIAGAGTGKTRTLVHRVAHLIARGAAPERILLLTFTRRAAQEMLARAERLVGSASHRVAGGTFHATAHRLLRRFGPAAGIASDFTIMDQGDAEDLMQLSRAVLGLAEKKQRFPKKETLHAIYSRHVNTEYTVERILAEEYPQFAERLGDIGRVFADYTERKAQRNLVDYDDLLLFWSAILEQAPTLADKIAALYDHILVDEYQDTNVLQARILRGMCRAHKNVTAVGDDAQSIYSFRGASFRNILDFPTDFEGTTIVTLEQNYRSTQAILDTTNEVIARAAERFSKRLWTARGGGEKPWLVACQDERAQTRFVADRVLELHEAGTALSEIAVLVRAGYMTADLEIELTARGIPFEKWGGIKFLEAAHVKDVLAFLRLLENPRDEVSWYRVLLLLPGIGDVTARSAIEHIAASGWDPTSLAGFTPPPKAREAHTRLAALLAALVAAPSLDLGAEIGHIRRLYDDLLRERYDDAEPRLNDLEQLQTIAASHADRAAFLSSIALEPPAATRDLAQGGATEDDVLVLSTVHSAKGKEWDVVFVLWAADGFFPLARATEDPAELEEERRLMYVAMTRARNELLVTYPLHAYPSRYTADYSLDQLSRFIDRGVRETMQRVVVGPENEPAAPPAPTGPTPTVDLRAILRGRFGV
ncbi:Helicase superfamily 1 UvrD-related protein [Gemmatirosa kalamazoonensis]|uniref:DNA 3'-5' helicase n=1 Tax=Gemmatirosa kalamazoonensis TaxID=861299 RepID=W0RIF7_9BACT|nr:ATP-dependent helicase [Gemmatirosa kalamazoonensis]AHG90197.1 Helicase superfamily 1 UvrD-related protein [Gemmatirosa kalamazoonensis]